MRLAALTFAGFLAGAASGAAGAEMSCRGTVGLKFAQTLATQCWAVTSATRPPCSPDATCEEMLRHIRAMCGNMADERRGQPIAPDARVFKNPQTAFCADYLDVVGEFTPSFDCAKAQSETEKAICASRTLTELDLSIARVYKLALATESTTQAEQRAWLKERDAACTAGARESCLADAMRRRIKTLHYNGLGVTATPPARPLAYPDLIGTWEARSVRVFAGAGITNIEDDDYKYIGLVVAFEPGRIVWLKGTERRPPKESDNCNTPALTALDAPLTEPGDVVEQGYDKVPGAYAVRCGEKVWGPPGGAVIKGVNADNVRLYWWDGAILTLKRVKN